MTDDVFDGTNDHDDDIDNIDDIDVKYDDYMPDYSYDIANELGIDASYTDDQTIINEDIPTISDVFIHYLFGQQKTHKILLSFINAVLADMKLPRIGSINVLNPFNIKQYQRDKYSILDVRAEDDSGRLYNIEVQRFSQKHIVKRCLYYYCKNFTSQLEEGKGYGKLNPVIGIVLTNFLVFPQEARVHTIYHIRKENEPVIKLTDLLEFHYIQLPPKFNEKTFQDLDSSLADWLKFFGYPNKSSKEEFKKFNLQDEGLIMATVEYENFIKDPELIYLAEMREKTLRDLKAQYEYAQETGLEEGRKRGLEEGREEGRKKGIEEGRERGLEEGREEGIGIGVNQGRKEMKIQSLIDIVKWLIGEPEKDLLERLQKQTDFEKIDNLRKQISLREITSFSELEQQL